MPAPGRGKRPDEMTISEVAELWGFGHTWTWYLIRRSEVVPYRHDHYQIYVKRADAENYQHSELRNSSTEDTK